MKKLITVLLTFAIVMSCGINAFAAESDTLDNNKSQTNISVYAKYEYNVEGVYPAPITDGEATITTDDNITVSVTNAPVGSVRLMVVPVPKTETEAWQWIKECLKATATPVHTFDIYFEDQDGNRIDAYGAEVTVNCPHCAGVPVVCSLDTDGTVHVLNTPARARAIGVTFTTNGSTYYIMAEELPKHDVKIEDKPGGDVEISDSTPKTGDDVTITPKPDEGKVVDKVIVKDGDGKEISVKDNGDGTYTYEQPDGDVTIEVTFKDEEPAPAKVYNVTVKTTTDGTVKVSANTATAGQTVTITATANSGKVVDKVTVTDASGKTVTVTANTDGTYSFKQPEGDVTVEVTFKNKPSSAETESPTTGDDSHVGLWIGTLVLSGMGMLWFVLGKRKKNEYVG